MAYANTQLLDSLQISKKFEKRAAFCTTEESVFGSLGTILDPMRTNAQAFINQSEDLENISNQSSLTKTTMDTSAGDDGAEYVPKNPNVDNLKEQDNDKDTGWLEKIKGNFSEGGATTPEDSTFSLIGANTKIPGFLDSDCIPCGLRLQLAGQLDLSADLKGIGKQWLEMWKQSFQEMLNQINQVLKMFNNVDKFIDICAFFKFINDFVCIPDLQRMLSVLMALLSKIGFEFGGFFDLVVGLVGPLLTPFLSGMVSMLNRYVLMVVKPIECIIDAIQNIFTKLDYNVLFKNIENLDRQFTLNPPPDLQWAFGVQTREAKDPKGNIKVPFFDAHIPRTDIDETDPLYETEQFNLLGPVGNAVKKDNAEKQAAVETATEELAALRKAGRQLDGSDSAKIEAYRQKERAAKEKLQNAQDQRDLSAIGRVNKQIDATVANFKSILMKIIGYLREAVETIEAFVRDLFDEFKKIMGQWLGGSGGIVFEVFKKLEILQIVGFIGALITGLTQNRNCDPEDEGPIRLEDVIDTNINNIKIWTDNDGKVHIEQNDDEINNAIDTIAQVLGNIPKPGIDVPNPIGNNPNVDTRDNIAAQKLKGLIELTGDDAIDSQIARTVESFTATKNVTFDCPLKTSVAQSEQVNTWIKDLNNEV